MSSKNTIDTIITPCSGREVLRNYHISIDNVDEQIIGTDKRRIESIKKEFGLVI